MFGFPSVRAFEAEWRNETNRPTLALTVNSDQPVDRELSMAEPLSRVHVEVQYAGVSPFPIRSKRTIQTASSNELFTSKTLA
jgi:hypothetical protein